MKKVKEEIRKQISELDTIIQLQKNEVTRMEADIRKTKKEIKHKEQLKEEYEELLKRANTSLTDENDSEDVDYYDSGSTTGSKEIDEI